MLILLVFSLMLACILFNLLYQGKSTQWYRKDHIWYSQVQSNWFNRRKSLNLFAYSRNQRKSPNLLDNSAASGDSREVDVRTTVVVPHASLAGATEKYDFELGTPKATKVLENVVIAPWCQPECTDEGDTAVLRGGRGEYIPQKTFVDPTIRNRMKVVENQEDMKLVSSLARAKNESWQKPAGLCDDRPAIKHIRGVRRRLD